MITVVHDVPWLPPYPYNHRRDDEIEARDLQVRLVAREIGSPLPPRQPSARELRWRAEDWWLMQQWRLLDDVVPRLPALAAAHLALSPAGAKPAPH